MTSQLKIQNLFDQQKKIEKKNIHKVLSFQIKEEKSERKKAKPKLVRH